MTLNHDPVQSTSRLQHLGVAAVVAAMILAIEFALRPSVAILSASAGAIAGGVAAFVYRTRVKK
jgi:xanthine/uracil permease